MDRMATILTTKWTEQVRAFFARFATDQHGSTAIEYGLIASAVAVSIAVLVSSIGTSVTSMFGRVLSAFTG